MATLLMVAAAPATFANTAQVNVTGTITPASCQISFANGGDFDLGEINAATLNSNENTNIQSVRTKLDVACDAPTRFALSALDINEADNTLSNSRYLLGTTTAGERMGYYAIRLWNAESAGSSLNITRSVDSGVVWSSSVAVNGNFVDRNTWQGFTASLGDSNGPGAIQQLSVDFDVRTVIYPSSGLTLRDDQAIIGSMALTVEYL